MENDKQDDQAIKIVTNGILRKTYISVAPITIQGAEIAWLKEELAATAEYAALKARMLALSEKLQAADAVHLEQTTTFATDTRGDLFFHVIDCLLKPDEADEVIGDLTEQYNRRLHRPKRAIWWLGCQTVRIIYGVAMAYIHSYFAAKAGRL